ncbi:MAG: FHA domain-containing protein [Anaerolineae bacterium]|nr:FHA domain-containing protein [Anaerolineae bacterium]
MNRDTVTIGRDITNDIVINDPEVSRHHARLVRTAAGYTLEDLRSTNGTFVNRQRISTPHPLSNGDLVGMGETVTLSYETLGIPGQVPGEQTMPAQAQTVPSSMPPPAQPVSPSAQPQYAPPPMEEETESDMSRWIVIGCAVMTLVFCCVLVIAAIYIDSNDLYCEIPIMQDMSFFCIQ